MTNHMLYKVYNTNSIIGILSNVCLLTQSADAASNDDVNLDVSAVTVDSQCFQYIIKVTNKSYTLSLKN